MHAYIHYIRIHIPIPIHVYIYIYAYVYVYVYVCMYVYVCIYIYIYINVRCVASTHVTSSLSVQVHGGSHALTCRPAGFHSEAAGAIDALVAVRYT